MTNKIFREETGETLEVYMEDMLVKSDQKELCALHLQRVFKRVQQYNIRLNPNKCTLNIRAYNFLDFYWRERRIKTNPN